MQGLKGQVKPLIHQDPASRTLEANLSLSAMDMEDVTITQQHTPTGWPQLTKTKCSQNLCLRL